MTAVRKSALLSPFSNQALCIVVLVCNTLPVHALQMQLRRYQAVATSFDGLFEVFHDVDVMFTFHVNAMLTYAPLFR